MRARRILNLLAQVSVLLAAGGSLLLAPVDSHAQTPVAGAPRELKVGIVTLLSGPASSTFGIPAKNASDMWIERINR